MDLTFNLQENKYVAEFEATADFNLHIEGVVEGNIKVYQRTACGEYAYVRAATPYPSFSDIYDYDFVGVVWPKTIKVVCATEPSLAVVTTDGEVNEILSQEKEIEITANGTTEVTPDSGFAYLSKVKVKTNVASEGGGSAVAEDDILYFFSGTASDSHVMLNLTKKEVLDKREDVTVTFGDIVKIQLWNIGSVNGMSMLSTLPFTVDRLDENIVNEIVKSTSIIGPASTYAPISNYLGAVVHGDISQDKNGAFLLMYGGLFRLTTGAGKVYEIEISE